MAKILTRAFELCENIIKKMKQDKDIMNLNSNFSSNHSERKRRVYDQYGKDGLLGHNERSHRSRRHDYDDFDFGFVFRSPDEVFREFFGVNSPFADLFGGGKCHTFSAHKCIVLIFERKNDFHSVI